MRQALPYVFYSAGTIAFIFMAIASIIVWTATHNIQQRIDGRDYNHWPRTTNEYPRYKPNQERFKIEKYQENHVDPGRDHAPDSRLRYGIDPEKFKDSKNRPTVIILEPLDPTRFDYKKSKRRTARYGDQHLIPSHWDKVELEYSAPGPHDSYQNGHRRQLTPSLQSSPATTPYQVLPPDKTPEDPRK